MRKRQRKTPFFCSHPLVVLSHPPLHRQSPSLCRTRRTVIGILVVFELVALIQHRERLKTMLILCILDSLETWSGYIKFWHQGIFSFFFSTSATKGARKENEKNELKEKKAGEKKKRREKFVRIIQTPKAFLRENIISRYFLKLCIHVPEKYETRSADPGSIFVYDEDNESNRVVPSSFLLFALIHFFSLGKN